MELKTYTNLWQVERRIYRIYDLNLPYAVSLKQLGFFLAFTVPWVTLLVLLQVPFATPWHLLWVLPPIGVAYVANRPLIENKSILQLVGSQAQYLAQSRQYTRLSPWTEPDIVDVGAVVWHDGPAPTRSLPSEFDPPRPPARAGV